MGCLSLSVSWRGYLCSASFVLLIVVPSVCLSVGISFPSFFSSSSLISCATTLTTSSLSLSFFSHPFKKPQLFFFFLPSSSFASLPPLPFLLVLLPPHISRSLTNHFHLPFFFFCSLCIPGLPFSATTTSSSTSSIPLPFFFPLPLLFLLHASFPMTIPTASLDLSSLPPINGSSCLPSLHIQLQPSLILLLNHSHTPSLLTISYSHILTNTH